MEMERKAVPCGREGEMEAENECTITKGYPKIDSLKHCSECRELVGSDDLCTVRHVVSLSTTIITSLRWSIAYFHCNELGTY
mgnify:CR=1